MPITELLNGVLLSERHKAFAEMNRLDRQEIAPTKIGGRGARYQIALMPT